MIPTRYRAKIPSGLAFPVGAELLTEALCSTPQASNLSVAFHDKPTIFASQFQLLLRSDAPLPVLRAEYRNLSPGLTGSASSIEAGFYDVTWSLEVFPVPDHLKSAVRRQLETTGLRQMRAWFELRRPETWQHGRHSLTLLFNPSTTTLLAEED